MMLVMPKNTRWDLMYALCKKHEVTLEIGPPAAADNVLWKVPQDTGRVERERKERECPSCAAPVVWWIPEEPTDECGAEFKCPFCGAHLYKHCDYGETPNQITRVGTDNDNGKHPRGLLQEVSR